MRSTLGILGIVCFAIGLASGLLNWFLSNFYLETVEWEGIMVTVDLLCWAGNVVGYGLGGILICVATLLMSPSEDDYLDEGAGDS